jgi:tetratricopeptide (TPR) repeat protein
MSKYRIQFIVLAVAVALSGPLTATADTWHLEKGRQWKPLSAEGKDKFLLAVAEAKRLVNTSQTRAARKAFDALKNDFPEIAGPDLDVFIKAELYYCRGKFSSASRSYEKLLKKHPESALREAALDRQFAIATAYLAGQKRTLLGIFKIKGYAEGIRIMEKINDPDRAGFDTPLGMRAAVATAEAREDKQEFSEAYLKWWEISLEWETGPIARDALLAMARCKRAVYNRHPEHRRPFYDASNLRTARTCYERYQLLYPEDAEEIGVDEILKEIDEQLALKELTVGQYYEAIGNEASANLYYEMVLNDWPGSKAAETAKEVLGKD